MKPKTPKQKEVTTKVSLALSALADMKTYRVFFLDILGNDVEGYEVNDRSETSNIQLPVNFTDQDLILALIEADILSSFTGRISETFSIDGDDNNLYIDALKSGRPLLQLEVLP